MKREEIERDIEGGQRIREAKGDPLVAWISSSSNYTILITARRRGSGGGVKSKRHQVKLQASVTVKLFFKSQSNYSSHSADY